MTKAGSPLQRLQEGYITGTGIFSAVPNSAESIAFVLSVSSGIEHHWAGVLSCLSGTEIETAMLLLDNLRTANAKEKAILQLAKMKLGDADFQILRTAAKALEPHRDRRNDFAHGVWAKPIGIENRLVLLRGKHISRVNAVVAGAIIHGRYSADDDVRMVVEERDIFGQGDFDSIVVEASIALSLMRGVSALVLSLEAVRQGRGKSLRNPDDIREEIASNWAYTDAQRKQRRVAI